MSRASVLALNDAREEAAPPWGAPIVRPDPEVLDWATLELPDAWPDELRLSRPRDLWKLVRSLFGRRRRVAVPDTMPGADRMPRYLLQEFHNLPNGNYSKKFTEGYINSFDRFMLGRMRLARRRMAESLNGCRGVLDIGTAGGATAAVMQEHGVADVWGIDPSPYLLQHAARKHPGVRFVQGLAEELPFRDHRFEGVSICFVLHEIPPRTVKRALAEVRRVLVPGGRVAICEPGPTQLEDSAWTLLKREGMAGLYFRFLARKVHEPFVRSWHRLDMQRVLADAGFEHVRDEQAFPVRHLLAR